MKYLVIALLIIFSIQANKLINDEENNIVFEMDSNQGEPFGIVMKGVIDPWNIANNRIHTFVKIMKHYIPLLDSTGSSSQDLTWERIYRFQFLGCDVSVDLYVQLIVGWRVLGVNDLSQFFNATYVPYIWGWARTLTNGTVWPGVGSYGTSLDYIRAYSPIGVQLYRDKLCFGGSYAVLPVTLVTHMDLSLYECAEEIIDEIINGVPIHLDCGFDPGVNFTHLNVTFTDTYRDNLFDTTCITFT